MNRLPGVITHIHKSGAIRLVDVNVDDSSFSALLIESALNPSWLMEGKPVYLVFKETEVTLAKELQGKISTRNRMPCKVLDFERGVLLSKIALLFRNYTIYASITTRAADSLQIAAGDDIEALVKSNEVVLIQKNNP